MEIPTKGKAANLENKTDVHMLKEIRINFIFLYGVVTVDRELEQMSKVKERWYKARQEIGCSLLSWIETVGCNLKQET